MSHSALESMSRHGSLRPAHEPKRTSGWASFMLLASLMFVPALLPLQSLAQTDKVSPDSEVSQSNEIEVPARRGQSLEEPERKAPIGALSLGFGRPVIATGRLDRSQAEQLLTEGLADLVGFGHLYIGNPDLVERFRNGWPLNEPDPATYYGGGARGYTDYPNDVPTAPGYRRFG